MTAVWTYRENTPDQFVLECDWKPNTNGLGKTQRAIIDYLATAPAGFPWLTINDPHSAACNWHRQRHDYSDPQVDLTWHQGPHAVLVPTIATAVYHTDQPSPAQIRVVQRAVRRLEQLGLVTCRHATVRYIERPYRCVNGQDAVMEQPVAALAVALRWNCDHKAEQQRLADEYDQAQQARQAAFDAMTGADALQALLGASN